MDHLTPEQLLDLAQRARPESSMPHLQSCTACRQNLADLRATLSAVADVGIPEPSPLFWDHLSARVHGAIEGESVSSPFALRRWSWPGAKTVWVGAVAAAALAIAVAIRLDRRAAPSSTSTAAVGALMERANPDDDASLALVADLVEDLDWEAAGEAGLTTHVGVDDDAVSQLDDAERRELQELLKGELSRPGA